MVERHINYVSDLINPVPHSWKELLIRALFEKESAAAILKIPLPPRCQLDVPRWLINSKGVFSVKDAYLYEQKTKMEVTGGLTPREWKKIWSLKIQHQLKKMILKVAANALPIRSAARMHSCTLCPLCQDYEESPEHLFLGCPISIAVWRHGPWPLNFTALSNLPIQQWLQFILELRNLPSPNRHSGHR